MSAVRDIFMAWTISMEQQIMPVIHLPNSQKRINFSINPFFLRQLAPAFSFGLRRWLSANVALYPTSPSVYEPIFLGFI
jgi:hypothetical protein